MALKVYQLKEKYTTEITTWQKSNNKWWTFRKKLKNWETKLKLLTKNKLFITSSKKDLKLLQQKSETLKDSWLITIWLWISSESIPGLKMSRLHINMLRTKMISSRQNLMRSFYKKNKSNKKPKFFKINWPVSTNKCKWDSMNLIHIKETNIKDSWVKIMILWPSTAKNKIKWKIC